MKKKSDKDAIINESCIIMNISKSLNNQGGNLVTDKLNENVKISLKKSIETQLSIPHSANKIKLEPDQDASEQKFLDNGRLAANSPPLSTLGPGVEIKGIRRLAGKSPPLSTLGPGAEVKGIKRLAGNSPPLSALGPGAEIKGKIGHPVPCSSKLEDAEDLVEDSLKPLTCGTPGGGRLTFFKEGKPLLELSHYTEQGSWVQVKSKTYWPPPSTTATTTTIHHPFRHDTPTTQSDDCSSLNSSPWSGDHVRKQVVPVHLNRLGLSNQYLFFFHRSPYILSLRQSIKFRKDPFFELNIPVLNSSNSDHCSPSGVSSDNSISKAYKESVLSISDRKKKLENAVNVLSKRVSLKINNSLTIYKLFEKVEFFNSENNDPSFITPRKRYLRTLESDCDSHSKKKIHSINSISFKNCDKKLVPSTCSSASSFQVSNKSAISSQHSSAYSIDSILSNSDSDSKKSDSFLRTLLNPDKARSSQPRHQCVSRSCTPDNTSHLPKLERTGSSPYAKERKEINGDSRKRPSSSERSDSGTELNPYLSAQNFNSLYMNPYFDPRYMMLHPLSTPPPFLQSAGQPGDMASAMALAAAAASGYPINPLQMSALTANGLLPPGYPPSISASSHQSHIRSPTPSRASPLASFPHSPSPKLSPAPPTLPHSPHMGIPGSPRDIWTPSSLQNSPHKFVSPSPTVSPPLQDAPLNLSKPKQK